MAEKLSAGETVAALAVAAATAAAVAVPGNVQVQTVDQHPAAILDLEAGNSLNCRSAASDLQIKSLQDTRSAGLRSLDNDAHLKNSTS